MIYQSKEKLITLNAVVVMEYRHQQILIIHPKVSSLQLILEIINKGETGEGGGHP